MVEFVFRIGGQAGQGANLTGRSMGKVFTRGGYHVVGYPEYPSLIRGGHNVYQVIVGQKKVNSPVQKCDLVIALNKDAIFYHKDSINENGGIIYDSSIDLTQFKLRKDIKLYPVPYMELVKKAGGTARMENTVAMGATLALCGYPLEKLNGVLSDEFARKGEEIIKQNIAVAKAGYDYVIEHHEADKFPVKLKVIKHDKKLFMGGNEAVGMGAIKAGMKIYSAYPMTPASTVMHYLASKEAEYNIAVKHTEDEISAVLYAIGSNYAGVRAMTGTSGGGFALMSEALGMAALAETPIVINVAQRVGPSTGMPTWTEQADLKFVLNASQGDFLRIVLAPGDIKESFFMTAEAFNFADKYQLPVLVLTDKFLAETHFSEEPFEQEKVKIEKGKLITGGLPELEPKKRFKRYEITKDGVSPRPVPGTRGGLHVASSYEHREDSYSTESFSMRAEQVNKRNRKIENILKEMKKPKIYGARDAKVALVCWGSQKLPLLDAVEELKKKGIEVAVVHFSYLFPVDKEKVQEVLSKYEKTIMFENNSTGQYAGVLKEYADIEFDYIVLKYDGRQFFPEQVREVVEELKKEGFKGKNEIIHVNEREDLEYYNPAKYGL
ncbi:2-oxoacid:acceptor oxidoreductase subunit alpha [Candidatus Micrarchaeota archaeon]|nr:2-oxoacid:acceptor oxidoreductase subunit alpha [Candidatus Micrarchaeota archaeon]